MRLTRAPLSFKSLISTLIFAVLLTACSSKNSSSIDPTQLQNNDEALTGVEDVAPVKTGGQVSAKPGADRAGTFNVNAGGTQFTDPNLFITLRGQIDIPEGGSPILSVGWTQLAGPEAIILNPNQLETQILVPNIKEPARLIFRLFGVNAENLANADSTSVFIQPLPFAEDIRVINVAADEGASEIIFKIILGRPAA